MTDHNELQGWRTLADGLLTPIENVKVSIKKIREQLDIDFPDWKAAYDREPFNFLAHDSRREFFVTLRIILQNAQLGFMFMRDQLTNEDWWHKQTGKFNKSAATQALQEYALMLKFFSFHGVAVTTEETLRAIVRADAPTFGLDPVRASFQAIYDKLLQATGQVKYRNVLELMRLTRNTIHNNGIYRPQGGMNKTVNYGDKVFLFEINKPLSWLDDTFPAWTADQVSQAMKDIVRSSPVRDISACPRGN